MIKTGCQCEEVVFFIVLIRDLAGLRSLRRAGAVGARNYVSEELILI